MKMLSAFRMDINWIIGHVKALRLVSNNTNNNDKCDRIRKTNYARTVNNRIRWSGRKRFLFVDWFIFSFFYSFSFLLHHSALSFHSFRSFKRQDSSVPFSFFTTASHLISSALWQTWTHLYIYTYLYIYAMHCSLLLSPSRENNSDRDECHTCP